jgi:hypothetical protein
MKPLETVLADWREQASVLRRNGHTHQADSIERLCADVGEAAEEFLTWLNEQDAALRSGRSPAWLRKRYPEWEQAGHARRIGGRREYRMVIVPQKANLIAARQAGRDAVRRTMKGAA